MSVAGIVIVDGSTARGPLDLPTKTSNEHTKLHQSPAGDISDSSKSKSNFDFYEFEDFESFIVSTTPLLLAAMLLAHSLEVALLFLVRISRR